MAFVKPAKTDSSGVGEQRKRTRDRAGLLAQLDDADPVARRWAARDLAAWPETSAPLLDRLRKEPNESVREMILTTLTSVGDATAVAGLVDCLRTEDVGLRNDAIEAMKQLPAEVAPIMGALLADPDPDVRIFAVNVLESLRHPQVEAWLIGVIERDAHLNVCATAVDLLGEVGSSAAHDALSRLKARFADVPFIQFAADVAQKRIAG